jgi:alpha-galactosidase
MKKTLFSLALLSCTVGFAQKFEQLAMTPPMGWNSWNTFQTKISEQLVMQTADKLVSSGMRDAGYVYLVLDDGWMSMHRDSVTGDLIADPEKFPHGMKAVADYVHSRGLKFGLYNCAGTKTCAGYPGTRGYEYQDARYYASVGIDYLKFDWCYADGINAREAYATMSKAIRTAGRPVVFSLCEWGTNKPWEWAAPVGELWRTTGDIYPLFDSVKNMGTWTANGILHNADLNERLNRYAGPGHWNDPDMLEVGNGTLTEGENRAHFSLWSMMAAPLIAGNDITRMTSSIVGILTDKGAIAIDQDSLGIQGFRVQQKDSLELWVKPLSGGNWAVCFLNRGNLPHVFNHRWAEQAITDPVSNRVLDCGKQTYSLYDVWGRKRAGTTGKPFAATIPGHDVVLMLLTGAPAVKTP